MSNFSPLRHFGPHIYQLLSIEFSVTPVSSDQSLSASLHCNAKQTQVARNSPVALAVVWAEAIIFERRSLRQLIEQSSRKRSVFSSIQKQQFFSNLHMLLRFWPRLEFFTNQLLQKPLPVRKKKLKLLIALGLQRLREPRGTPSQIIESMIKALSVLGLRPYKALVYAIFKKAITQAGPLDQLQLDAAARHLLPPWLYGHFLQELGEEWAEKVALQSAQRSSLWVRVVGSSNEKEAYKRKLSTENIQYFDPQDLAAPQALKIMHPIPAEKLPWAEQGGVYIQDLSSQRVLALIGLCPSAESYILEMCAAPGSKTLHLLQTFPKVRLQCLEKDSARAKALAVRLASAHLSAKIEAIDALEWNNDETGTYDIVLLDAPCSGTGILARHPDAKWVKKMEDFEQLQSVQAQLLEKGWKVLKMGGQLIYSTCSILPAENFRQIHHFLENHPDASVKNFLQQKVFLNSASKDVFKITSQGVQIFPSSNGGDGFFYSVLEKKEQ